MKRILASLFIVLLLCGSVLAAGSVTRTSPVEAISIDNKTQRVIIELTFVADASNATFPTYVINPASYTTVQSTYGIKGWYLYSIETNPGATGPTNGAWDLDITDASGYLVSNNLIDDRSSTATQMVVMNAAYPMIQGDWVISIADNLVNSASVVVRLTFVSN